MPLWWQVRENVRAAFGVGEKRLRRALLSVTLPASREAVSDWRAAGR
jgi:hypothetical protein